MKKIFFKILSVFSFMCMFVFNSSIIGWVQNINRPKVSIIVPVYKVEKWLPECMESLINQTLEDIEIICIDDGSPDNCGKILDNYAEKDKRVKVIHQENQGVCVARNAGLDIASGEYISVIDSDDYVDPKCYETAYKWAKKGDVDILQFSFNCFKDGEKVRKFKQDLSDSKILNLEQFLDVAYNNNWSKLMKKSIIDSGIRFVNGMPYANDFCFNFMIFSAARKFKNIPAKLYNYRIRKGSLTSLRQSDSRSNVVENAHKILKNIYNTWNSGNMIEGNEISMWKIISKFSERFDLAKEILDLFGKKLCKPELIKKYPKWIKNEIKCLENAAKKRH